MYTLANQNFGQFLRFFQRGLNPFKIQSKFKSQKVVEFIFQILFRIGSLANEQSCSISISDFGSLNQFWIINSKFENGLGQLSAPDCAHLRAPTPCDPGHLYHTHRVVMRSALPSGQAFKAPTNPKLTFTPWSRSHSHFPICLHTEQSTTYTLLSSLSHRQVTIEPLLVRVHPIRLVAASSTTPHQPCDLSRRTSGRATISSQVADAVVTPPPVRSLTPHVSFHSSAS
jgi:hypothetical protein